MNILSLIPYYTLKLALGPFAPVGVNRNYDNELSQAAHTVPMRIVMGLVIYLFAFVLSYL